MGIKLKRNIGTISFDDFLFMNLGTTRSNILNNDKFNSNFILVANVIKFSANYYTLSFEDCYRSEGNLPLYIDLFGSQI